jgi:hypothetical protein
VKSEKMATRGSAELDKRWFSGQDDLPEMVAENLEVISFGRALNAVLGKNGWDGKAAAGVGLELASDNRAVKNGQFFIRGPLSSEQGQVQASKLWERAAADAVVSFKFPHGGEFDFTGGSLASEYLEGEAVKITVERGSQQVPAEEWPQIGITQFIETDCVHGQIIEQKRPEGEIQPAVLPSEQGADGRDCGRGAGTCLARSQDP